MKNGFPSGALRAVLPAAVILLILGSCATTLPMEPRDPADSLVIGQLLFKAEGYDSRGYNSINGEHRSPIELTVKNLDSGERLTPKSRGREGLFSFPAGGDARWVIEKVEYRFTNSDGSWISLYHRPDNAYFTTEAGMVNNLGLVEWNADRTRDSVYLRQHFSTPGVRESVELWYPDSAWLERDWRDTRF